jgi:hypothetical protein
MASAVSITRLHAAANVSTTVDTKPAPVNSPTAGELKPEAPTLMDLYQQSLMAPVRRRYGSPRAALNAPALMSTMHAPTAMDRSGAFAALAARDRAAVAMRAAVGRWQERQARTGAAEHQQHGPLAIQI